MRFKNKSKEITSLVKILVPLAVVSLSIPCLGYYFTKIVVESMEDTRAASKILDRLEKGIADEYRLNRDLAEQKDNMDAGEYSIDNGKLMLR